MYDSARNIYGIYIRELDIASGEISDWVDYNFFTTKEAARRYLEVEADRELSYGNRVDEHDNLIIVRKLDSYSHITKKVEYRISNFGLFGKFTNERR